MPAGHCLRVEVTAPAVVRWSPDGWKQPQEVGAADTGLGVYVAELPTDGVAPGGGVVFTFRWTEAGHWEGRDFRVAVTKTADPHRDR